MDLKAPAPCYRCYDIHHNDSLRWGLTAALSTTTPCSMLSVVTMSVTMQSFIMQCHIGLTMAFSTMTLYIILCWVAQFHCYGECHLCSVFLHRVSLCYVPLCQMLLYWLSLCHVIVSQYWVSLYQTSWRYAACQMDYEQELCPVDKMTWRQT